MDHAYLFADDEEESEFDETEETDEKEEDLELEGEEEF